MNFWGFSPLYLRELAQRFPAFLDENLPRNPLKCEYFVPSIVDAQLHAGGRDHAAHGRCVARRDVSR